MPTTGPGGIPLRLQYDATFAHADTTAGAPEPTMNHRPPEARP